MKVLPKIKEFNKEELLKQFKNGEIDINFMCEYISKRDRVYNMLIDEVNFKNTGFNEIREYIIKNSHYNISDYEYQLLDKRDITNILEIMYKYMKEDENNDKKGNLSKNAKS